MTNTNKITAELLKSWEACEDGYNRFCELYPEGADLQTAIDGLILDGKEDWAKWLFDKCKDKGLFLEIINKGYFNSGYGNSGSYNSGDHNSGSYNSGDYNSGNYNSGYGNSGDHNSGDRNSGSYNSGDRNSGSYNSGDRNSGSYNSGGYNSGYGNSGDGNSGSYNSGDGNSGDRNSGSYNSGDHNSGNYNSGDRNSGSYNSGDRNSGNYNSGDGNSGFFNTVSQKLWIFNKPTNLKYESDIVQRIIEIKIKQVSTWISYENMSDEEKEQYPTYSTTGGYLKKRDYKYCWQKSWEKMSISDQEFIKSLPNFDAKIFFEITGINVNV
jgi:hypothetical protein